MVKHRVETYETNKSNKWEKDKNRRETYKKNIPEKQSRQPYDKNIHEKHMNEKKIKIWHYDTKKGKTILEKLESKDEQKEKR